MHVTDQEQSADVAKGFDCNSRQVQGKKNPGIGGVRRYLTGEALPRALDRDAVATGPLLTLSSQVPTPG
jgi:hypothetical protein